MGYSNDVMQRARARLAAAKADRESENRQHLDEAYAKVPRLREIDRQLRLTMALAAQAVFSSGGNVNEALEEAKRNPVREAVDTSELEYDRVCKNPKCISQIEQELPQLFRCTDKAADIHRCIYCEQKA